MAKINTVLTTLFIALIRGYQLVISPFLGNNCRYYPSCSEYAKDAILEYGIVKGLSMGGLRLMRCHPWHEGGFDPVPSKQTDVNCSHHN